MDWLRRLVIERLLGKIDAAKLRRALKAAILAAVVAFSASVGWKWVPLPIVQQWIEQAIPEPGPPTPALPTANPGSD